jgi:sugar transferase (PEP-CTERM/EpsH1 system associated)
VSIDKRPGKDVGAYVRTWRVFRRLKPSIVHTRNFGALDLQWVAAAAGVRRRVHGEHGLEGVDLAGGTRRRRAIRRACRPLVQRYVPMSKDLARWLERDVGVRPDRIRQLYSGVDTDRFRPRAETTHDETRPVTIGTVGRLDPVKNQAALLEAFSTILAGRPGLRETVRLRVVGHGPLGPELRAQAESLGVADRVDFSGARDDVPEQLRSMDVFALPSHREGISNTILEAMATGLPVVAARTGGNPELVLDGVTGALYDPASRSGLEQGILRYLTDPVLRRHHGAAARDRVVQNFSLDSMVARYLALYDEVMAEV